MIYQLKKGSRGMQNVNYFTKGTVFKRDEKRCTKVWQIPLETPCTTGLKKYILHDSFGLLQTLSPIHTLCNIFLNIF